jgi:hypothetical protein
MPGFGSDSLLSDILLSDEGRTVVQNHLPGIINSPMLLQLRSLPLGRIASMGFAGRADEEELVGMWERLALLDAGAPTTRVEVPAIVPTTDYEGASVARGSAAVEHASSAERWSTFEISLDGPSHGNPFVDVDVTAEFEREGKIVRVGGFYDGSGRYLIRFFPETEGEWRFSTRSNARSLDGVVGRFTVDAARPGSRGVVRVADTFHFAYDDGTRFLPVGTTAYAWTHQTAELEQETLATLADAPFTKVRMCVFPKSYLFNANEPELYPYEGSLDGGWDFTRFDPAYFRHLERRIMDLAALGIETDLILFHAYDRWGFSDMGRAADDRFVRYLTRRLSAIPSVWWSLVNEYDLLWSKTIEDWERMAAVIVDNDPVGHLLSIHNCLAFYDYSRPWITHCSMQRVDVYRTSENTDSWRAKWQKPIVIDECAYEGDIDQGWGNITGEEMTRRFWEGAIRGGYVGHGETYLNDRDELWWSKGGELIGTSPARIGFLATITAEAPSGVLDPAPSDWDVPWAGVGDEYRLAYFGFNRPSYRDISVAPGRRYVVDVIDTWGMTVERLDGIFEGSFRVPLPARQYMAIRLTAIG